MIWCLHGFLGQGSDWELLRNTDALERAHIVAPSLFSPAQSGVFPSLHEWAREFCDRVKEQDPAPVLIGYSLGGRLALHALVEEPALFQKAVIVSSHIGLANQVDRKARRAVDALWSERFLRDPWEPLIEDWESQAVFGGRKNSLPRNEASYSRAALASSLRRWSLGEQDDLRQRLGTLRSDVLWVVGEEDDKYRSLADPAIDAIPRAALFVCPSACHRVPWESPDRFIGRVNTFLNE